TIENHEAYTHGPRALSSSQEPSFLKHVQCTKPSRAATRIMAQHSPPIILNSSTAITLFARCTSTNYPQRQRQRPTGRIHGKNGSSEHRKHTEAQIYIGLQAES
ncbi:unnamed protein product, partial [Ectocarpus sp. 6 AP-2014]